MGSDWSSAAAINANGNIVGQIRTRDGEHLTYLYRQGKLTTQGTLGTLRGSRGFATDLNNPGHVVRVAESPSIGFRTFRNAGGKLTELGSFLGHTAHLAAKAVNNLSHLVG